MSTNSGFSPKIYYNVGSFASPSWTHIWEARDITMPLTVGEVDASNRGSAFKKFSTALIELGIEFDMTYQSGTNTNFAALKTHILARTTVELAVMDDAIATVGASGFRMACKLFSQSFNFPLEDGMTLSMSAKPTYSSTCGDPAWFTVS